jgi:hypothetical protein
MRNKLFLIILVIGLFMGIFAKGQVVKAISLDVTIKATNGRETFSNKTGNLFGAETIDANLLKYGNKSSKGTKEVKVDIFKVETPANFFEILSSFGVNDLSNLWLTQAQIIGFCREHQDWFLDEDVITFFLCRSNDSLEYSQVYFMIGVYTKKDAISIFMSDIGQNSFWDDCAGGVRLVVR